MKGAHMVLREPNFITIGDSSLEAAGAKSNTLNIYGILNIIKVSKV